MNVSASLTAACLFLVFALIVAVVARPRPITAAAPEADAPLIAATVSPGHPAAEALSKCPS
jgi:hypothetical protein